MRLKQEVEFGQRISALADKHKIGIRDLACRIGMSYEMTRRYIKGWAMPSERQVLERLAVELNTTVGYLIAGEGDNMANAPLFGPDELTEKVARPTRIVVSDDAMFTRIDGLKLYWVGCQVLIRPGTGKPGDVVAIRSGDRVTLRRIAEGADGYTYVPRTEGHATYAKANVLGVVAEVHGKMEGAA